MFLNHSTFREVFGESKEKSEDNRGVVRSHKSKE
jgi:hypothetical protein